jgi:hypothetical protein
VDILDLGTPRLSYRRLINLIRHLPRESATAVAMIGEVHPWDDSDYLLARIADSVAHLGWMFAGVHAKNAPKKPPDPVPRPGDKRVGSMTVTINQSERSTYVAASLTFEELQEAVERQTGAPRGIANEVD